MGGDQFTSNNPISLREGEKRLEVTDLSLTTPAGPLAFTRHYRQSKQTDGDLQFMGLGWNSQSQGRSARNWDYAV